MRCVTLSALCLCMFASLGILNSPANAGGYGYYGYRPYGVGGDDDYYRDHAYNVGYYGHHYYSGAYYGHRYYRGGYYGHRYYSGGYYHRNRHVWYTSHCCYRKVVRHSRSVHYEPVYRGYSYYRRPYYRSYYYGRPYSYRYGYYGRSYYRHYR